MSLLNIFNRNSLSPTDKELKQINKSMAKKKHRFTLVSEVMQDDDCKVNYYVLQPSILKVVNDTITQIPDGEPVIYVELSSILEGNGYSKPDINSLISEFISKHCASFYSHLDVVKHEPSWLLQPYSFTGSIDKSIVETKPHILFMKELSSDDFQLIVPLYSGYYWSAIMRVFQAVKSHLGSNKHKSCINELTQFMNKIYDYYKISDPNRMNDDEKNQIFVQLNKFWKRNADNFASAIKSVALNSNDKGVGHE